MWLKWIIVLLLFAVIISLGLALRQLVGPPAGSAQQAKLVKALTLRVGLSIVLFLLLLLGTALGWITPHGVYG
jgi:hypothetical protein